MERLLALGHARVESRFAFIDGKQVHYLEAGSGEAMLLIHGAGGGAANWYRLFAPLAERFHVVAVDLPGFGLSDSVEPQPPLGRQVAGHIATLLEQIQFKPVHIVGTSFGGLTGFRLAQMIEPRSLVLIDAAGLWPEAALGLRLSCNRIIQSIPVKTTRSGTRWLLRTVMLASRLDAVHEAALADYLYWSNVRTDRRALARGYRMFAGLRGQLEVFSNEEMHALAKRMLIVWGEKDRFLPARSKRTQAALAAGAQLRIIPNVGHSPNWEAPEALLREILEFTASK